MGIDSDFFDCDFTQMLIKWYFIKGLFLSSGKLEICIF